MKPWKTIAVLGVFSAACSLRAATVATYDGGELSEETYRSWLDFQGVPENAATLRSEVERLLVVEALAAFAVERGADREPAMALTLERVEDAALANAYRRRLSDAVEVPPAELESLLEEHPRSFHRPRKVRLRNLYKRFPPGATAAQKAALRAVMDGLLEELAQGADFGVLARRESDSRTRSQDGLIGNVAAGRLLPAIDAVAMNMAPGETSAVLETQDGLTILRCDAVMEAVIPSREEALAKLGDNLERLRAGEQWRPIEKRLLDSAAMRLDLAAAADPATPPDHVVLEFAGHRITRAALPALLTGQRRGVDPTVYPAAALERLLRDHVLQAQTAAEARMAGVGDDTVNDRVRWQRLRTLAAVELKRRHDAVFEPPTEHELRRFVASRPEEFQRRAHYDLAVIRIAVSEAQPGPDWNGALDLREALIAGGLDFAEAARRHSDHPSAAAGGALGWIDRRRLTAFGAEVWRAVQEIEIGQVSEVLWSSDAAWIIKLAGVQDPRPMTFEEARAQADRQLGTARAQDLASAIEAQVADALAIEIVASDGDSPPEPGVERDR